MKFTLLSATFKNAGDFLIYERSKALLRAYAGLGDDYLEHISMRSLEPYLDAVNRTDRIVICGGPGYQTGFYPDVYPLVEPFTRLLPPLYLMGLGWGGAPVGQPERFQFSAQSHNTLKRIQNRAGYISCRDEITYGILQRAGLKKALMTGCPVWYDLESIGKEFEPPTDIKRIVVTPPQRPDLHRQCAKLLVRVRIKFPKSKCFCVFHRGILPDEHTPWDQSRSLIPLALVALSLGYKVIDASYGTDKIQFYRGCDLHIGYRVHAHLFFVSARQISYLLHEDGRGAGQTATLETPGVSVWETNADKRVLSEVEFDQHSKFHRFHRAIEKIETTFPVMLEFLNTIRETIIHA